MRERQTEEGEGEKEENRCMQSFQRNERKADTGGRG